MLIAKGDESKILNVLDIFKNMRTMIPGVTDKKYGDSSVIELIYHECTCTCRWTIHEASEGKERRSDTQTVTEIDTEMRERYM